MEIWKYVKEDIVSTIRSIMISFVTFIIGILGMTFCFLLCKWLAKWESMLSVFFIFLVMLGIFISVVMSILIGMAIIGDFNYLLYYLKLLRPHQLCYYEGYYFDHFSCKEYYIKSDTKCASRREKATYKKNYIIHFTNTLMNNENTELITFLERGILGDSQITQHMSLVSRDQVFLEEAESLKGQKVQVWYLPHSKMVVDIKRIL